MGQAICRRLASTLAQGILWAKRRQGVPSSRTSRCRRGVSVIEYCLLLSVIAGGCIGVVQSLGQNTAAALGNATATIPGAAQASGSQDGSTSDSAAGQAGGSGSGTAASGDAGSPADDGAATGGDNGNGNGNGTGTATGRATGTVGAGAGGISLCCGKAGCHAHACRGHAGNTRRSPHAHGKRGHGTRSKGLPQQKRIRTTPQRPGRMESRVRCCRFAQGDSPAGVPPTRRPMNGPKRPPVFPPFPRGAPRRGDARRVY